MPMTINAQPESDGPNERFAKPGDVLSQWWTLGRLLKDRRRAPSHDAVFWVILDAHRQNSGKCPASVRFIELKLEGSITSHTTIVAAIRDLVSWGYLQRLDRRRRSDATAFLPVWVISNLGATASCSTSTHATEQRSTSATDPQNASATEHRSESYLPPGGSTGGEVGKEVSAPADAAKGAAGRVEGFERVWRAYGKVGSKAASRAAFAKIVAPDIQHIVERAASWAASAKPCRPRMPFEKWLTAEKYDEADRKVKSSPARARTKPKPANDNIPVPPEMRDKGAGEIAEAKVVERRGETFLVIKFADGTTREVCAQANDTKRDTIGRRQVDDLMTIVESDFEEDDVSSLVGRRVRFEVFKSGEVRWHAA